MQMLQVYSLSHSNEPATNLQQLYKADFERRYPYGWHKDFKRYGKDAGFKASFFEKYWFFPRGSTSQLAKGEVVMMTSHPFPMRDGKPGRAVVTHTSDLYGNYGYGNFQFSEDLVQKILKEERIMPYPLPAFPPPPPEPQAQRFPGEPPDWLIAVDGFFFKVAERTGIGGQYSWILRNLIALFALLIGVWGTWALWRRSHR